VWRDRNQGDFLYIRLLGMPLVGTKTGRMFTLCIEKVLQRMEEPLGGERARGVEEQEI